MPIQKFASQAYNYKANNYTHNHILLNSSGESLSSSHYSFKNGTGSTSSNCSSNDDSPIVNGSNNLYPNTHSLPTKHFAHESEKACDKLTAQKNSKIPDYLPNGHFINMDNNYTVNLSSTDRNISMPDPYEKLNVLYENNTIYSASKDNLSNISEFNIVSTQHDFSPLTSSANTCKDDEKTPLLSSQTNTEFTNYQANESFLKTHLTTSATNIPNVNEGNQKSESTIIMIDEDDDINYNNKDRNLVNDPTQSLSNFRQGYEMSNDYSAQTTSLQNTIDSFMSGNNSRWDKEVKISDLSAISNRPHHNNFKSLELGMASRNVNEVSQQTTTAKSNHANLKTVTDYDQQICFFNSPSTSSFHNSFSPYNASNLDVEMKVLNEGGSSKYTLETSIKPPLGESDILKKCSKSKKKKAITNNGENNLNISPYPMDDNLTRVAYPQKDNCPDKNSNDSKSKKAKKREKIINKNVKSQYIAKDDQGKKDINFLVAFIEGTQSSIATTTYKDYKTSAHARTKDHIRPMAPLNVKCEGGDDMLGENSSLVDSTFSVTTLVNETAFLSHDIDDDEHLHETISDTQSQKSQTDRSSTTYKNMKKHFSSEDLRPHLFEHHSLLFSPSPKVPLDIGALTLDDNSTKSDEDYSTPPQDFQENFQIVQKKQYRKENPIQPPQDFGRNRGHANRNSGRTSGNPSSSSSLNQFVPRPNKDGGRAGNINAPNPKPSKDWPEPGLKNEEKSCESTTGPCEQPSDDKTHHKPLGSSKPEHFSGRDRNTRNAYGPSHNPKNFGRGRPAYTNHPNYNGASRAVPSAQAEVKEPNAVQNFNAELDFPPLVCPKTSKSINGAELVTQPEATLNQSLLSTTESPSSTEAADLDNSQGKKDSSAIENDDVKSSYASMLTKSKQQQQVPVPAINPTVSYKAKEQTPSQPTPLSNSDTLKFQDSSILEVSNELCHQNAISSTANPASSALNCAPAPSSPRVIFVNSDNSKSLNFGKSKFRSALTSTGGAAGGDDNAEEGEVKLNFTFGFDIDSPQVRDIMNAKDDQDEQLGPSQQRPQTVQESTTPPPRVLEWLEAERAKMTYLAPYFANIWAQMQKNDPSPSYT